MDSFAQGVASLVTPDRATIEALCMLAEDAAGSHESIEYIARVILSRLAIAPAPWKLPIVYLLDAIGKNSIVGPQFQAVISGSLFDSLVGAFEQVAPPEQKRLQHTVNSWFAQNVFPLVRDALAQRMATTLGPYVAGNATSQQPQLGGMKRPRPSDDALSGDGMAGASMGGGGLGGRPSSVLNSGRSVLTMQQIQLQQQQQQQRLQQQQASLQLQRQQLLLQQQLLSQQQRQQQLGNMFAAQNVSMMGQTDNSSLLQAQLLLQQQQHQQQRMRSGSGHVPMFNSFDASSGMNVNALQQFGSALGNSLGNSLGGFSFDQFGNALLPQSQPQLITLPNGNIVFAPGLGGGGDMLGGGMMFGAAGVGGAGTNFNLSAGGGVQQLQQQHRLQRQLLMGGGTPDLSSAGMSGLSPTGLLDASDLLNGGDGGFATTTAAAAADAAGAAFSSHGDEDGETAATAQQQPFQLTAAASEEQQQQYQPDFASAVSAGGYDPSQGSKFNLRGYDPAAISGVPAKQQQQASQFNASSYSDAAAAAAASVSRPTASATGASDSGLNKLLGMLKGGGAASAGARAVPMVSSSSATATPAPPHAFGREITNAVLALRDPDVVNNLTTALPNQCKTCALRYSTGEELAAHVRSGAHAPRRSSSSAAGVAPEMSRSYYLQVAEWLDVHPAGAFAVDGQNRTQNAGGTPLSTSSAQLSTSSSSSLLHRAPQSGASAGTAAGAATQLNRGGAATAAVSTASSSVVHSTDVFEALDAARRRRDEDNGGDEDALSRSGGSDSEAGLTVPVPEDGSDAVCAVCGESFKKAFDDETENWVYSGAVTLEGEYYHAGCASTLVPRWGGRGGGGAAAAGGCDDNDSPTRPTVEGFDDD